MKLITQNNFKKLISALIQGLPERQQQILSLYYADGLSFAEIADVLGDSEACVRVEFVKANSKCLGSSYREDRPDA